MEDNGEDLHGINERTERVGREEGRRERRARRRGIASSNMDQTLLVKL